ncbi:MAG: peptide chain release factor N(5)-glutamine methyltransferase [Xanthomonadales bacterium]|nr:peptide chain release factor N(5)-glutamine methyltransferase [Xanthomonadales bacterium]
MTEPATSSVDDLRREGLLVLRGPDGAAEVDILLAHVLGHSRAWLRAHGGDAVDRGLRSRFRDCLARRRVGMPVAYLTGSREFWSLPLRVTPDVLIPRADTERLVEMALERLPVDRAGRVLDLGTGSGAIALALARERPRCAVLATDYSPEALTVAEDNARRLGMEDRIRFLRSDWFAALRHERPFDLVVSNPPYLAAGDRHLREGDLRHEPVRALIAGRDGLDAIRDIVAAAPRHLEPDGWLLLEHGMEQGAAVRALMLGAGLCEVATGHDLEGRERVTHGRRPASWGH